MFSHKKTKIRALAAVLVIMISMTGFISGCKKQTETPHTGEQDMTMQETNMTENPEQNAGVEMWNPYKPLYFPADLVNQVYPLLAEDGLNYYYEFHITVEEQDVLLLSIILGPDDVPESELLGQLNTAESGMIKVHVVTAEINPADWSREQFEDIAAKQQRIRDITAQFYDDENFIPAN